jgi:ubiquinone/menaquinone biosynthesis C-methylase UbiE
MSDSFAQFEHQGWERVANLYDSVWSSSTRQFIAPLLDAAGVSAGMSVLDVGCGPGYVCAASTERGARAVGLDFSKAMIAIARNMFPQIEFREGDALNLPFGDASFDRVIANFSLLHIADPERACAQARRVLKPGGKFAFTVWAPPGDSPYAKIIDDALEAHADLSVELPAGPSHYLFSSKDEFREALQRAGFEGASMVFNLHIIEWSVPIAGFVFDAERTAGVRTAGLLARQPADKLRAIETAITNAVRTYPKDNGFAIPNGAYIVAVSKGHFL